MAPTPDSLIANLRPDLQMVFDEFDVEANIGRGIARQVFPIVEVGLQASPFPKVTIESMMQSADTVRGSKGNYNRSNWKFTSDSYATSENGIEVPIDERNKAMFINYINDPEVRSTRFAKHLIRLNQEIRIANIVFDAGTFTPTSVANEWDDAANATPITDVEAAIVRLWEKGVIANALVINWQVFRNLRNCQQIIDRINSAGAGNATKPNDITTQMLAQVFDLDRIIVAGMQKNTANENQPAALSPVWSGEYAAVTRVSNGQIEDPGVGLTFHWDGDGSLADGLVETYHDPQVRGDVVRVRNETHEKLMYEEAVELLDNITT